MYLFNAATCCKILLLLGLFLWTCHAEQPSTASTVKISAVNGITVTAPKDGPSKRNVKANDLAGSSSAASKSYDPPPEFYRGPGSTNSASASSAATSAPFHVRDSATAGFISKPITFPDSNARHKYPADSSSQLANAYNSWQLLKGSTAQSIQDRISVKNYGHPEPPNLTAGYPSSDAGSYSGYDSRPYASGGHYADYAHSNHYPTTGAYPSSGPGGGSSIEGLPFDVYGGKGHYAGGGGEYSYTYADAHEPVAHKGHPELSQKALLAKSFLIPLASAAVLGIAAALVSNPLLLQLGTVAGGVGPAVVGKRRRRDVKVTKGAAEDGENEGLAIQRLAYGAHQVRSMRV